MTRLSNIATQQLRDAASAWRQHAFKARGWFSPAPNMSVHDRIDELIDEIERLRAP
jgi:hypothetical protein